ncbi:hypothetical protein KBB96_16330 [Luteolibacter ambystomatis]|uniref:Uncharacterized protein n=1 Tax=Luteolibacter ambystomatis TaxID=2824561 RepID=A0A975G7V4_9BACT|nr:hypothetical protein [Luteolibacter ambystomatis]QUE50423.1 hypothetical protein KBB96_16330 [Luteolibacter ambystomatis]
MSEEGLGASLARAAKWHWNLLGVGAGGVFALLSGVPLGVLAILGGLELAYLGFLGLNPRFQRVLRGQKMVPRPQSVASSAQLEQLMSFLSTADTQRFAALRQRCSDLLELRRNMDSKEPGMADQFRGEGLDRMLWLFLKLLHQKSGLERFLATTSRESIIAELSRSETQLKEAQGKQPGGADGPESRLVTSIRERIATVRERLENHQQAGENWELVCAEIDKTEQQINRLCEVGMTLRDSGELAAQVDSISSSLQSSERAFADASVGGLLLDEVPPPLLSAALPVRSGPPPLTSRVAQSE